MSGIKRSLPTIVQIAPYYPPHLGGVENCVAQIAERLQARGYAVSVYTSCIGFHGAVVAPATVRVYRLRAFEFAHTPIMLSLFFRLLILPRHSLMHVHIAQAAVAEIVCLVSWLRRIPYIAHFHMDVDPSGPCGCLLGLYKRVFLTRALRSAARIICLSEPQREWLAATYALSPEVLMVIPNGVAEDYFIERKRPANPLPRLLFVGRLVAQKNLPLLLEAVAQMTLPVVVDIVGEGELRERLADFIRQYRLRNVFLHGRKSGSELLAFYRSADLFVLPSFKEGLALSLLEALAAGLPVVASDAPEIRPILAGCGMLIQDPTACNYARALEMILSHADDMQRWGALAAQKARVYSWENTLHALEYIYKGIDCDS